MKNIWHIGIDEVGRGAFAGPVMVGAFAIRQSDVHLLEHENIRDSKQLSATRRLNADQYLELLCKNGDARFAVASQSASAINERGIMWCLRECVAESLRALAIESGEAFVFIDAGLRAPDIWQQQSFVHGDDLHRVISAASIVAKVTRDAYMGQLSNQYPEYQFDRNVGYGTRAHRDTLYQRGSTPEHRNLWVKNYI